MGCAADDVANVCNIFLEDGKGGGLGNDGAVVANSSNRRCISIVILHICHLIDVIQWCLIKLYYGLCIRSAFGHTKPLCYLFVVGSSYGGPLTSMFSAGLHVAVLLLLLLCTDYVSSPPFV